MYLIKTSKGFVAGFNDEHQVVQTCKLPNDDAKRFQTPHAVKAFLRQYADAGYGFTLKDVQVIKM